MAEPADINVDELRRRARRRLVGAVVLALGVAVVVPMLLETEQKPLGEDVSVKIPPVDSGKFVNRLNDDAAKSGAPAADAVPPADEATKGAATAPAAVVPPAPRTQKYDTHVPDAASDAQGGGVAAEPAASPAPARAGSAPEPAPAQASAPEPAHDAGNTAEAMSGAASEKTAHAAENAKTAHAAEPARIAHAAENAKTAHAAEPAKTAHAAENAKAAHASEAAATTRAETKSARIPGAPREGYAVQLAAFADDRGANSLAGRLKRAGYAAYTEPLKTSKGTLWRVRVGPYPSREAAVAARDKLKTEGQSGIVAAIK